MFSQAHGRGGGSRESVNPTLVAVTALDLLLRDGPPAVCKKNLTRAEEVPWAVTEA